VFDEFERVRKKHRSLSDKNILWNLPGGNPQKTCRDGKSSGQDSNLKSPE
jgi:hypothetical protein